MADIAGALAAIESRFTTAWGTTTPYALANQETAPVVVNGSGEPLAWILFEAECFDARIRGVGRPGNHVVVDEGVIEATVFVPLRSERAVAREHAVAIGELFRTAVFYDSEPGAYVRTWTPVVGRGERAESENPAGLWWSVPVSIPFEFWHRA